MASRSFRVGLSAEANADLSREADYLAQEVGPELAARVLDKLTAKIASLTSMPERFREERFESGTFRIALQYRYRIFFIVNGDEVRVVRIVHGARDVLEPR